jgi:hypothetical protein
MVHNEANALRVLFLVSSIIVSSIIVSPARGGLTNERCYAMRFLLLFHPPEAGWGAIREFDSYSIVVSSASRTEVLLHFLFRVLLLFHPPEAGLQMSGVMRCGFYCCFTRRRRAGGLSVNLIRILLLFHPLRGLRFYSIFYFVFYYCFTRRRRAYK